uniref:Uncharacterized protein n=1 Tax=Timema cristinae TaxID=61476 RepID=A0A7R9CZN3_TIMCR|nr:unnamed protein product [Timema cristinae]
MQAEEGVEGGRREAVGHQSCVHNWRERFANSTGVEPMDSFETKSQVVAVLSAIDKSVADKGNFPLLSVVFEEVPGLSSSRAPCMNPQVFPLVQREPCPCDLYISRPIGDWSDCVLDRDIVTVSANGRPALGVCGSGSRYRRIGCYNKDNDLVEPSPLTPPNLVALFIPLYTPFLGGRQSRSQSKSYNSFLQCTK